MKHLLIALTLALTLTIPLFATMDFTQKETIPIANGTFSYAELRSVEGTDRIVVYSQDTDNIYLTISDIDGNVLETVTLAMTDNTTARKMSYFEQDETACLLVATVTESERNYSETGYTSHSYQTISIYDIETGDCIDTHDFGSYYNSFEAVGEYGYANNCFFEMEPLQPEVTYGDEVLITSPYSVVETEYFMQGFVLDTDYVWRSYTNNTAVLSSRNQRYSSVDNMGSMVIRGDMVASPRIVSGIYRWFSEGTLSLTDIYVSWENTWDMIDEETGVTNLRPYLLLSDKYPDLPKTFTLGETLPNGSFRISELNADGNRIWTDITTNVDLLIPFDDLSFLPPSCCFPNADGDACTIYFGLSGTGYEIRNRINGDIEEFGDAPFAPLEIDRIDNENLVYLAPTDDGIVVWHSAYVLGSEDPNDTPRFDLSASNYPNPFNPTTTISYLIPSTGHVELNVYNTRGQQVKTLVNDIVEAGENNVVWHGDNDMGETVSSGVYLYRLKTEGKNITGRMLMIK